MSTTSAKPDPAAGVYPCRFGGVNRPVPGGRRGIRADCLVTVLIAGGLVGCVAPQSPIDAQMAADPPTMAVWYSVATAAAGGQNLIAVLEADFAQLHALTLNTVIVRHAQPEDLPRVFDAAQRHGLRLILNDPVANRYVRGGGAASFGFAAPALLPHHPVVSARFLGYVVDDNTLERAGELADLGRKRKPPIRTVIVADAPLVDQAAAAKFSLCICRDDPDAVGVAAPSPSAAPVLAGGIPTVTCRRHRKDELTTVRQWLADYHLGLLEGRTDGVAFDCYRALPGNWSGIVDGDQAPSAERVAMIRRIVARAQHWGTLLGGLHPEAMAWPQAPAGLRAARFFDAKRQYVLIVNASPTAFVHKTVSLPDPILTPPGSTVPHPIARAVRVPSAEDTFIGPVHAARGGNLVIPLQLAPGEAALFELF